MNKNEALTIPNLVPKISFQNFEEVFAVDGRSTDNSVQILEDFGVFVIPQLSQGRGHAFHLAFEYAKQKELDALVFFSCDGNENPADLWQFRGFFEQGCDLVIASRMLKGARNEEDDSIIRLRKWGNKIFAWMAYLTFGWGQKRITDPINGFRGITVAAWSSMDILSEGFSVEYESSIKAYLTNLTVMEFPTYEFPRLYGESGAKAWSTSKQMLITFFRSVFLKKKTL